MKKIRANSRVLGNLHTEVEQALTKIAAAAERRELVAVIGTGVSMALTDGKHAQLSWTGLIRHGFAEGVKRGLVTTRQAQAWKSQIESEDLDDLLSAAEFMGRKLGSPTSEIYSRWLTSTFKEIVPTKNRMHEAVLSLHRKGIQICTLNYDLLLEAVTGVPCINVGETNKAACWVRRESPGILHLHGSWDVPASCVLGIRDYETTLGNEVRDFFQRTLGAFRRLLFVGCGDTFADPNFTSLVGWLAKNMGGAAPEHYALVLESEVPGRLADRSWHGFVEPLSYGKNRTDLPEFLLKHIALPSASVEVAPRKTSSSQVQDLSKIISHYREFLVKDCGQMTIEGVRADMDIAQRKFDLERLFVPLEVSPVPPEIPASDPEREQKLEEWREKNRAPISFGEVFAENKSLALLAFPGGGKSLLLKRLAVAYAGRDRRLASTDSLPDLDLTPVLIRCREWRAHIRLPILTLLGRIEEITGQVNLRNLGEALLPLFQDGRALLLVDGLDEIHDDADREIFVENLEGFMDEYKLTRVVVTSREAGFGLVAPSIARFCDRWRIAPLNSEAIGTLCNHWTELMSGSSAEALIESQDLAKGLLNNASLHRLAENPLLLTMLLVVKHGAGRLPLDRVGLYGRAAEVLLDTWNIKGHEPLNLKEAIPQLACVAFQLMRTGKQTATAKELLALLEEARQKIPQIHRYARDTADKFLKRVELRSSLLLEAGHQLEDGNTVPFYQFRHLTFQEYLAAVAVAEGHYFEYQVSDTVLTPLQNVLTADEWKEVVPMAAVLARKQAEPLISALVMEGVKLKEANADLTSESGTGLPPPIGRLMQCLVEEAQATPETLTAALQLIAFFSAGCRTGDDWSALAKGPYAKELLNHTWLLYRSATSPPSMLVRNSLATISYLREPRSYWESADGKDEIEWLLDQADAESVALGLMTMIGSIMFRSDDSIEMKPKVPIASIERHFFHDVFELWEPAVWAWSLTRYWEKLSTIPSTSVLDRLLVLWFSSRGKREGVIAGLALTTIIGLPRNAWAVNLANDERETIRKILSSPSDIHRDYEQASACVLAFHAARLVVPDEVLVRSFGSLDAISQTEDRLEGALRQFGSAGEKVLSERKKKHKNRARRRSTTK